MALGGGLGRQVQTASQEGAERRVGGEKPGFQACGAVSWPRPSSAHLLCMAWESSSASGQPSSCQENPNEVRARASLGSRTGGRHGAGGFAFALG